MSRSHRKVLGCKDCNTFMKKYANRVIRRKSIDYNIASGKAYVKETCQYDISDWTWFLWNCKSAKDVTVELKKGWWRRPVTMREGWKYKAK